MIRDDRVRDDDDALVLVTSDFARHRLDMDLPAGAFLLFDCGFRTALPNANAVQRFLWEFGGSREVVVRCGEDERDAMTALGRLLATPHTTRPH